MRLIEKFRLWVRGRSIVETITAVERRCNEAEDRRLVAMETFEECMAELTRLHAEMLAVKSEADSAAQAARAAFASYDESLNTVRAELRVASDVTIPALVAAHKLLLSRYDAEVAIETRRQVGASVSRE